MMKRIVFLAMFLAPACLACGQTAQQVGMAVKLRNYREVRRAAGAFLSQVLSDYYDDLPDSWLIPVLNSGGMESIDQQGDVYFLAVHTPGESAWVVLAPVLSASFYLDALRANLGRDSTQGGVHVFTAGQSPDAAEEGRKLYVRVVGRTAVVSRGERACAAAASMLKDDQLNRLFNSGLDAPIRMRMTHSFISEQRERLFQALYRIKMMVAISFGSEHPDKLGKFYTNATLGVAGQVEDLSLDIFPAADVLTVRLTIRPMPGSTLAKFLGKQKPMEKNLLRTVPGDFVFACAGRAESIGELEAPYADSVRRLCALLPDRAAAAEAAATHAGERLKNFAAGFEGHFAAALVQPPRESSGVEYLRVYEVNDAARARENFTREVTSRPGPDGAARVLPQEKYGEHTIVTVPPAAPERKATSVRVAFPGEVMLVASGAHSRENIRRMIDACTREPADAITKEKAFVAATASPPAGASAVAVFSITGFLKWLARSVFPGIRGFEAAEASNGVAAWFVPGEGAFSIHLRIPVTEPAEARKAFIGDVPILNLPM